MCSQQLHMQQLLQAQAQQQHQHLASSRSVLLLYLLISTHSVSSSLDPLTDVIQCLCYVRANSRYTEFLVSSSYHELARKF